MEPMQQLEQMSLSDITSLSRVVLRELVNQIPMSAEALAELVFNKVITASLESIASLNPMQYDRLVELSRKTLKEFSLHIETRIIQMTLGSMCLYPTDILERLFIMANITDSKSIVLNKIEDISPYHLSLLPYQDVERILNFAEVNAEDRKRMIYSKLDKMIMLEFAQMLPGELQVLKDIGNLSDEIVQLKMLLNLSRSLVDTVSLAVNGNSFENYLSVGQLSTESVKNTITSMIQEAKLEDWCTVSGYNVDILANKAAVDESVVSNAVRNVFNSLSPFDFAFLPELYKTKIIMLTSWSPEEEKQAMRSVLTGLSPKEVLKLSTGTISNLITFSIMTSEEVEQLFYNILSNMTAKDILEADEAKLQNLVFNGITTTDQMTQLLSGLFERTAYETETENSAMNVLANMTFESLSIQQQADLALAIKRWDFDKARSILNEVISQEAVEFLDLLETTWNWEYTKQLEDSVERAKVILIDLSSLDYYPKEVNT